MAKDLALETRVVFDPGPEYGTGERIWQGIPGIERSQGGRLWAAWYSGGETEGPDNYVLVVTSSDDGKSWSEPLLVIDPPGNVRAFDPCLWHDPSGRLWLFWAQSDGWFDGRAGVWAMTCSNSDGERPTWSQPRRLCNGVVMNKPTVISTGEWLLPAAVWDLPDHKEQPFREALASERKANVVCSQDQGQTWQLRGGAIVPERSHDEHMIVEKKDGTLWMLVRNKPGIAESFSYDRGWIWTQGKQSQLEGPCSRFFIRRLQSGKLLLVNHYKFTGRTHLTASLSADDGKSWYGLLLLDERKDISYPDGVQSEDGKIYIIYDRDRYGEREILLATFREEDVEAGRCVTADAKLKQIVNKPGKRGE